MRRLLRPLGYRYIKGENRHYLADSVQNSAFRATYLQRKNTNRDKKNNPIRPEVYLDGSYVNVNHVRGATWLSGDRKRYPASVQHDESLFKPQLLELVRANKSPPFYMATAIATMYKHLVYFTPPYHPELQPIELIWGNMKGWISRHPAKTIGDLEEKVAGSKEHIKSENWNKAYRHIQKEENHFYGL
ncbi:hypothetical protein PHMEG_00012172 [Phytophthora megakarya]|uniref:Tc1-like transposase DDE domain-containing protein n=1 Tax=Phytophthora megakarya TaxID=4795 RepID=A0A225WAD3_9STRA|nr:hypothetical protein PHMEG_00012172 [Phytophthora megakarya]